MDTATNSGSRISRERFFVVCAWCVHGYTALGAVMGLLAIDYAAQGAFQASFFTMVAATAIDSSDGSLARLAKVRERTPFFDGSLLDNVIDYLTYVVAPTFLMLRAQILTSSNSGYALAAFVMVASAYGFCRINAKTSDHYFLGFPSCWNIVALYLFCFQLPEIANTVIVAFLAAMVFVPIKYIYPNRTQPLRPLTLALAAVWGILTIALVATLPKPNGFILYGSFAFVIYYFIASFVLHGSLVAARERAVPGHTHEQSKRSSESAGTGALLA